MNTISLEQLAEIIGGKLWVKGDLKRIYLNTGYNTKKMSTKTYVYQREDASFGVSCYVECASQPYQWCQSQAQEVIDSVNEQIDNAIWEIENPEKAFYKKERGNYFPYGKRVKYQFNGHYDKIESERNAIKQDDSPVVPQSSDVLTIIPTPGEMFGIDTKVQHSRFGLGTVIAEDSSNITINFDGVGEKSLIKKFAPLLKVA